MAEWSLRPPPHEFKIGTGMIMGTERPPGPEDSLYETEIAPALWKIMSRCAGAGMGMIALVEFEPGKVGQSTVVHRAGPELRAVLRAMACCEDGKCDLDKFIARHVEMAVRDGHDSQFLSDFGIPMVPKGKAP